MRGVERREMRGVPSLSLSLSLSPLNSSHIPPLSPLNYISLLSTHLISFLPSLLSTPLISLLPSLLSTSSPLSSSLSSQLLSSPCFLLLPTPLISLPYSPPNYIFLLPSSSLNYSHLSPLLSPLNSSHLSPPSPLKTWILRGHTPKPFMPWPEIWLHIIQVYIKTIRFDILKIIFESTHFRKNNFLFRKLFQFGEVCHFGTFLHEFYWNGKTQIL